MSTETTKRDNILRKVRALIDKANATNFPDERDAFLAKADDLMVAYAIEEIELAASRPAGERPKPVVRTFHYGAPDGVFIDGWNDTMAHVFYYMADLAGVRLGHFGWKESRVVGFERDLDYLDMLMTSTMLAFASRIAPKADRNLSVEDNVGRMKMAGLKWERIWELLDREGIIQYPQSRGQKTPYSGMYTRWCAENGIPRSMASPTVYRRSFIAGFKDGIWEACNKLKTHRPVEYGIVLHGLEDQLNEALYEAFPELRPHDPDCECSKCKPVSGNTTGNRRAVGRYKEMRAPALDTIALRSGREAANSVRFAKHDIGGQHGEIG